MIKKLLCPDNISLYYKYSPKATKKPTIIFLHGLGANWTMWNDEIRHFQRDGFSTLSLDLRGHGLSSKPENEKDYTLEKFARDVRAVIKKEKINRYVLVGHSFGACVIIVYCSMYKRLGPKALVLIEATYRYPYKKNHEMNESPLFWYILRRFSDTGLLKHDHYRYFTQLNLPKIAHENAVKRFFDEIYHTPIKSIVLSLDAAKHYALHHQKEIVKTLKHLRLPTLIIGGKKDTIIKLKYTKELHRLIPRSLLKIYPEGTHLLPLEHAKELSSEICHFLKKLLAYD